MIMDKCQQLRKFQDDTNLSSQEYFHTENRIHEEDHARRTTEALEKWVRERQADGREERDLLEVDSENDY